jgi:hypothetical protein
LLRLDEEKMLQRIDILRFGIMFVKQRVTTIVTIGVKDRNTRGNIPTTPLPHILKIYNKSELCLIAGISMYISAITPLLAASSDPATRDEGGKRVRSQQKFLPMICTLPNMRLFKCFLKKPGSNKEQKTKFQGPVL